MAQARSDFAALCAGVELADRTFLDVGFGQGLSLLCAAESGARSVGLDVDPACERIVRRNAALFPGVDVGEIELVVGSILDRDTQARLRRSAPGGGYDVVHAWGVLHHTGDLAGATRAAADLVAPGGHLILAIYNRHWSSPAWRRIKRLYNVLPPTGRRALVALLYPVIWLAKLIATGRDPKRQQRGMAFYYDVVDWVGGYPYEYATPAEVRAVVEPRGFECPRVHPPRVPTGCNELVFRRGGAGAPIR